MRQCIHPQKRHAHTTTLFARYGILIWLTFFIVSCQENSSSPESPTDPREETPDETPIISAGQVIGWGSNVYGQNNVPEGLMDVIAISDGGYHSLALKKDSTVVQWGDELDQYLPLPSGLGNIKAISAGLFHNIALTTEGEVLRWGGIPEEPLEVPSDLRDVVAISAGNQYNLALKNDGTVVEWGKNNLPSTLTDISAISVDHLGNLLGLGPFRIGSMAIKNDGSLVAWKNGSFLPIPSDLKNVIAISVGLHVLALQEDGTVTGWNYNDNYEIREINITSGLTDIKAIAAGTDLNAALRNDGSVISWNQFGAKERLPDEIINANVQAISCYSDHCLALIGE